MKNNKDKGLASDSILTYKLIEQFKFIFIWLFACKRHIHMNYLMEITDMNSL